MHKAFSLGLSGAIALLSFLPMAPTAIANASCDEYYIDPSGQRICFENGRPRSATSLSQDYLAPVPFLDRLARCQRAATALVLPVLEGLVIESVVREWQGDRCVLQINAMLESNLQRQAVLGLCRYRRSTLALLTDQQAYRQARTGDYSSSSNNARDVALSQALSQDCQHNPNWLDRLLG